VRYVLYDYKLRNRQALATTVERRAFGFLISLAPKKRTGQKGLCRRKEIYSSFDKTLCLSLVSISLISA